MLNIVVIIRLDCHFVALHSDHLNATRNSFSILSLTKNNASLFDKGSSSYFVYQKMCCHPCIMENTPLCLCYFFHLKGIHCDLVKSSHCIVLITADYSYKVLKPPHCHSLSVGGCVAVRRSYKRLINNVSANPAHDKWMLVTSAQAGAGQGGQ